MQAQRIARLHLRSVRGDGTWQGYKIAYVTFWAQSSFVLKRTPVCYGHQQSPLLSLNALCLKKHKTMEGQLDACARRMLISPRIREVSPGELETCSCVKSKEDYHILTYVYGEASGSGSRLPEASGPPGPSGECEGGDVPEPVADTAPNRFPPYVHRLCNGKPCCLRAQMLRASP